MTDVLIIGDTFRSPELRHEVPLGVPDPFVYLERDGARHVYVGLDGGPTGSAASRATSPCTRSRRSGSTSSYAQGLGLLEVRLEWAARACRPRRADAGRRSRTPSRPGTSTGSRRDGVELTVDQALFDERRRVKAGAELDGHPARPARRRGGSRRRRLAAAAGRERRRRALARRRAAHGRARQGCDAARLRRARLHGRGVRRRARAAGRRRPRHGSRPDQVRRARSSSTSGRATTRPPASPT